MAPAGVFTQAQLRTILDKLDCCFLLGMDSLDAAMLWEYFRVSRRYRAAIRRD